MSGNRLKYGKRSELYFDNSAEQVLSGGSRKKNSKVLFEDFVAQFLNAIRLV